jgi:hypothetical protein
METVFTVLRSLTLNDGTEADRERLAARLAEAGEALPGVIRSVACAMAPYGVINAGHLVWRLHLRYESDHFTVMNSVEWKRTIAPLLENVTLQTMIGFHRTRGRAESKLGKRIWRALVLRVENNAPIEHVRELERDLSLFPVYIDAIRNWNLSRITICEGDKDWTHIWEQEFDTKEGLMVDYMEHPIHWGWGDRWFDIEFPDQIVDPFVLQVTGEVAGDFIP